MIRNLLLTLLSLITVVLIGTQVWFVHEIYTTTKRIDAQQHRADSVLASVPDSDTRATAADTFKNLPSTLIPYARKRRIKP